MPCTTQYYCVCVRCVCVFTHAKVVVKAVLPEATPAACVRAVVARVPRVACYRCTRV